MEKAAILIMNLTGSMGFSEENLGVLGDGRLQWGQL
jgi:hypothetical protein